MVHFCIGSLVWDEKFCNKLPLVDYVTVYLFVCISYFESKENESHNLQPIWIVRLKSKPSSNLRLEASEILEWLRTVSGEFIQGSQEKDRVLEHRCMSVG